MSASAAATASARAIAKYKCETDFLFFVRYFFKKREGKKFIVAEHHHEIVSYLMRCTVSDITRLIVNMPPRYGKTELIVIMFMAWSIACNPRAKFIHLSYSDELALDNSSKVKEIILSDEFKELWPEVQLKDDAKSKKKWYTTAGGGVYATSSGGAVTGFGAGSTSAESDGADEDKSHLEELKALGIELEWLDTEAEDGKFYGAIIVDDPIKPADAESAALRKTINGRMVNTVGSRVNSRKTPIIVVMQRLHEEDTTGFLLGGATGEKWEHLELPALRECEDGTLVALWPFKHTVEELIRMRDANGYVFSGQYQQRPTPETGGVIELSWFQRYREEPAEFDQIVISFDTAHKEAEVNDPSVALVLGKFRKRWYLLDVWRKRVTYPNLKRTAFALCELHKPVAALVEDKASGQSLIQDMREDGLPVIKMEPGGISKVVRMITQAPLLEAGIILLPEKASWLYDFEQELTNFPLAKHDDQVDALSQFLKWSRKAVTFEQNLVIELPDDDGYDDYDDDF